VGVRGKVDGVGGGGGGSWRVRVERAGYSAREVGSAAPVIEHAQV